LSVINLGVVPSSFELLCAQLTAGSFGCVIITIYRPGSEAVTPAFFDDLSETLYRVGSYNEQIYVVSMFALIGRTMSALSR